MELSRSRPLVSLHGELSRAAADLSTWTLPLWGPAPQPELQSQALAAASWPQLRSRTASWLLKQSALLGLWDTAPLSASFLPWTPSHFLPHQTGEAGGRGDGGTSKLCLICSFLLYSTDTIHKGFPPFPPHSHYFFSGLLILLLYCWI